MGNFNFLLPHSFFCALTNRQYFTGNKKWVSAGFCGLVGCLTCMNEDGVTVFTQDTNYYSSTDSSGYVPRLIALRKVIESMDNSSTPADAADLLDMLPGYVGNNFPVCFPSEGREDDDVAGVLEYDGKA
jgi:hypothetical protein